MFRRMPVDRDPIEQWEESGKSGCVRQRGVWEDILSMLIMSGSILLCGIAILVTLFLIWRSERKKAAVGRRYVTSCTARLVPPLTILMVQRNAALPHRVYHC